MTIYISRTDLARNTRKTIERARKEGPVMVESYGEEQVAILDAIDYRLIRAILNYQSGVADMRSTTTSHGLTEDELQGLVDQSDGNQQIKWDTVVAAHQNNDISFGRLAELLGTNRFELAARYNRLSIPLHIGPATIEEAQQDYETLIR